VVQSKRRFRTAKVDPAIDRIRPGDQAILDLVAKGIPVEPKERTQRDMRRGGGGPGGRPRRDGDRPASGERPYGERSRGYGDRPYGGERAERRSSPYRGQGRRPERSAV
jgi:hypothetical protein